MSAFLHNLLQRHQPATPATSYFVQPRLAARFENNARAGTDNSALQSHDYLAGDGVAKQAEQNPAQMSLTPFPSPPSSASRAVEPDVGGPLDSAQDSAQDSQAENSAKHWSSFSTNIETQPGLPLESLLNSNFNFSHSEAAQRGQMMASQQASDVSSAKPAQSASLNVDALPSARQINAQPSSESSQLVESMAGDNALVGRGNEPLFVAPVASMERSAEQLEQQHVQPTINEQPLQAAASNTAVQAPDWLAEIQAGLQRRGQPLNKPAQSEPVINVSIGRVEIRAHQAGSVSAAKARSQPKGVMTLDEYLTQRSGSVNQGRTPK